MSKVYVFLADGFEEIEGLTVVDLLRRAKIETETVSITGQEMIHGSHGIDLLADRLFENTDFSDGDLFVLPGGMPGTKYLGAFKPLTDLLKEKDAAGKKLAAICAAPTVLGAQGLLAGKKAICYPGLEEQLTGAVVTMESVVTDGNITTSRGMGTAIPFALALIAQLKDQESADLLAKSIVYC